MEPGFNPLLATKPSLRQPILSPKSTSTPLWRWRRYLSPHSGLTMSFWVGWGWGHHSWFYSLSSKQDDSRDCPREVSAHPSLKQMINLSFLSKATNQETPVLAKPISAPKLGEKISNSVSLPVRGKSGLSSCAREATKPDFVYRKLIRQFYTTASDILHQPLLFTTISRNGLIVPLPTPHSVPLQHMARLT